MGFLFRDVVSLYRSHISEFAFSLNTIGSLLRHDSILMLTLSHLGTLTHWGRVTHICVSKLTTIIGSDNGLSAGWRKAIIWPNAGILLIGPLGTNCNEMATKFLTYSKKLRLKVSSGKWRPFCVGFNVLRRLAIQSTSNINILGHVRIFNHVNHNVRPKLHNWCKVCCSTFVSNTLWPFSVVLKWDIFMSFIPDCGPHILDATEGSILISRHHRPMPLVFMCEWRIPGRQVSIKSDWRTDNLLTRIFQHLYLIPFMLL